MVLSELPVLSKEIVFQAVEYMKLLYGKTNCKLLKLFQ